MKKRVMEEVKRRKARVLRCARMIADEDYRLLQVVEETGENLSAVYMYIMRDLPLVDFDLYTQCRERMNNHKIAHQMGMSYNVKR